MNKEIKEILDFKENADYKRLSVDEIVILKDYITNLQKENKILKNNAIHNDKVVDKAKWNEMIYKSMCEKALDKLYCYGETFDSKIHQKTQKELLEIIDKGK